MLEINPAVPKPCNVLWSCVDEIYPAVPRPWIVLLNERLETNILVSTAAALDTICE